MPKKFTPVEAQNYRQAEIRRILGRKDKCRVDAFIQCIEVYVGLYQDYSTRATGPNKRSQAKLERACKQAEKLATLLDEIGDDLRKSPAYLIAQAGLKPNTVPKSEQLLSDAKSLYQHIWFYDWVINNPQFRNKRGRPRAGQRDILIALMAEQYEVDQKFGPASAEPASLFSKIVGTVLDSLNQPLANPKSAIKQAKGLLASENAADSETPGLAEILFPEAGKK